MMSLRITPARLFILLVFFAFAGCKPDTTEEQKQKDETAKTEEQSDKKNRSTENPGKAAADKSTPVSGNSKQKILTLVNNARAKGCKCGGRYYAPAPPLSWNNKLERAAKKHSRYMKRKNILSHTGSRRSTPGDRIKGEGYNWMSFGENVAAGYANEKEAINGWLKSKGHCKNIMNPKFKEMGVARSGDFWTQCFGAR